MQAHLRTGPVEVIRGNESVGDSGVPPHEKTDAEIVALVSRRPSTLHDVCCGLGLNPADAAKRLHALIEDGTVRVARKDPAVFFLGAKSG